MAKYGKVELYIVEGGTLNRNSLPRKQAGGRCKPCKAGIHNNSSKQQNNIEPQYTYGIQMAYKRHCLST